MRELSAELQRCHREKLEARKEKILERKRRAHRLIVRGSYIEFMLKELGYDPEKVTDEEIGKWLKEGVAVVTSGQDVSRALNP